MSDLCRLNAIKIYYIMEIMRNINMKVKTILTNLELSSKIFIKLEGETLYIGANGDMPNSFLKKQIDSMSVSNEGYLIIDLKE